MMAHQLAPFMLMERTVSPSDLGDLARALHTEARLLGELTETLRRQRAGVCRDDVEAVDDSVFGAHRVIRTLGEARRRRRSLVERIVGQDELPLRDLSTTFEQSLTPELRDACARAQGAAELLARQIEINRMVLRSALDVSSRLLRTVVGGSQQTVSYTAEAAASVQPQQGAQLLDREV